MKKILLSVLVIFAISFVNAQEKLGEGFSKGEVFVSGSFAIYSTKTGDLKSNDFIFVPTLGFFVSENIAIGASLVFNNGKIDDGINEEKVLGYGADVFSRYYFTPVSKFSLFGQAKIGYGSSKNTDFTGDELSRKIFSVNLGAGLNYFVSNHFAIEAGWAGLSYNIRDNGGEGVDKTNSFGLMVDLSSINFGLLYKF